MKDLLIQIPEKQKDSYWSWVVCVGSFFMQFVAFGFHNSFGTFFVALLDKYGRSESETAWVGSMAIGLTYLLGPLSTYLCRHLGCRIVACTGSLLVLISAFLTSMVNEMVWMYLTFGLLNGLGSSMLYFSSLVVLIEYFHKHLSLATGIVLSGSGIGTFVINLMSQNLISKYGLSVTYKVMAGLFTISFLAGLTFAPLNSSHENPKDISTSYDKDVKAEQPVTLLSRCRVYFKIGEQWKNKGFILWTMATAVVLFAYYIPSVYLVSIAKGIGVPPSRGGLLVGFLAICQTVGKIVCGRLADHRRVNRLTLLQCALLGSAVVNCLLPLAKSYHVLVAYSVVQGLCDGSFGVLVGLVTHDIVGKRLMADALGCLYLVVAVPMTLGPPVAGMFYDHLGNYNAVFFLSSALVCTGICAMFLIPWLVPAPLYFLDKDLLLSVDDHIETLYDSDGQYDMSYVDEQKLADLFGKKTARNLLLERASLRNSCASTRASSFVLFSIVSEDQHRDISTYTSRQELAFTSGANTPLKGTPSTRRRHFDSESRASMYSLRQSSISVDHSDLHAGQDSVDPEHAVIPLIHREIALETVEEGNELERKVSCEETKPRVEIDSAEKIQANELPEEAFSVEYDNEKDRTSWTSDSNNSLKSSGTQLSQGTVDSGYYDSAWMSSSDVDTRLSVENFIANNEKLPTDIIYRSYSWNNVSAVTSNQPTFTSISEEYIDYVEDKDFASTKDICINSSELGNYSNTEAEYVVEAEILETVPEMVEVSSKERLPDFQKIADLDYLDDIYSLQVEKVFDEAEEYIRDKYDTCFDLKDNFRETVV